MTENLLINLTDLQSIRDVIYLYCRAMDRMDIELAYSVWHEDGLADYGAFSNGTAREFIDKVFASHSNLIAHSHQVTNILINVEGDQASSESYFTAALRYLLGGILTERISRGRYVDEWSKRGGRWAIAKRVYVHDFDDARSITDEAYSGSAQRNKTDPSYSVAPALGAVT